MKKKKNSSKPAEDKHEKFVRVVTPRVKKALKMIRLIGNQSGSAYAPTQDDIVHILSSLRNAVDDVQKRYSTGGSQDVDFSLD